MDDNQELSDLELFDAAVTDEGTDQIQTQQTEQVDQTEQQTETQAQQTETQADDRQVDENAPHVPSWRLREVNEEKRALADRLAALEAERLQWQRQSQQPVRQQQEEQQKPSRPDPLLDPEGYAKAVREDIRNELLAERREESLQNAAEKYGDEFKQAYATAQQRINPELRARMQESRNPGETLIKWYREQKTRAEIGDDIGAYKERLLQEALKDEAFQKLALQTWRGAAQPAQSNGRPRVELPPSMSGASRANAAVRSDAQDKSDRELFDEIAG